MNDNPLNQFGDCLESMIAIQMTAYPNDWPEADKREVAEFHLFGRPKANPAQSTGETL